MFLEGFLTPGESWETMGDPGAPRNLPSPWLPPWTPADPRPSFCLVTRLGQLILLHTWAGQGLWGLLRASPAGQSVPWQNLRTGRLASTIGAQCLVPGPASLVEAAGLSPGTVVSPMGFPEGSCAL